MSWQRALDKVWNEAAHQVAQQLEVHENPEVLAEPDEKQIRHVASTLDIAVLEFNGAVGFTAQTRTAGNGRKPRKLPERHRRCVKVARQLQAHRQRLYDKGLLRSRMVDELTEEARVAVEGAMHAIIWLVASAHAPDCVCPVCLMAKVDEETTKARADRWYAEYTGGFRRECGG